MSRKIATIAAIALLAIAATTYAVIYRGWVVRAHQPPPMASITIENAQGIDVQIRITNDQYNYLSILGFPDMVGLYVTVVDRNNDGDTKDANEHVVVIPPN